MSNVSLDLAICIFGIFISGFFLALTWYSEDIDWILVSFAGLVLGGVFLMSTLRAIDKLGDK